MVTHQCVSCSRQHPLLAPAFCDCGSTSFTALLGDDEPEAPTTSPEGGAVAKIRHTPGIAAATLGELQGALQGALGGPVDIVESSFGPAAAASTSGQASPPSVSESSSLSASAPKPGADSESDDDSEHDVGGVDCGQQGCDRPATHKFFWPSADEPSTRYACEEHARKAEELAPALGFNADVQPL